MTRLTCANCGKPAPKQFETYQNYKLEHIPASEEQCSTAEERIANRQQEILKSPFMEKCVRVEKPYTGNLMVIKDTNGSLKLWDGESYGFKYDAFCTLRCAHEFGQAAFNIGYRKLAPSP